LTALGVLFALGDPRAPLLAHERLLRIQELVTTKWGLLQGGWLRDAELLWIEAFELLDLDADAIEDLALLIAQGVCGRAEANEVLWDLLTNYGVDGPLGDLSAKTSNMVTMARRRLDAPPRDHRDMARWSWRNAWFPKNEDFSPMRVPRDRRSRGDAQGRPLRPPACWVPPPPPPDAPQAQQAASSSQASGWGASAGSSEGRMTMRRQGR